MSEREAFEKVFKTLSHTFNESLCIIPNTDKYYSNIAQTAWEAWQASANRQGYKIVPLEPTKEMLKELSSNDMNGRMIYKAMIGEVE